MSENLEVVKQGYEAFNRGDLKWVFEHLEDGIEWHDAEEVPGGQTHKGLDEVKSYLSSFPRVWEEIRFDPEEIHGEDETFAVMVRVSGRGRQSGVEVDAELAHLFEMRGGKCRAAYTYFDRTEALARVEAS